MVAASRTTLVTASIILCFRVALLGSAHAQPSCFAADAAKEILSKAGVPTNEAALLLLALTPDSTADASVDQVTQLSPTFASRNVSQLKTEDTNLDKAQQFVRTMPLTEDTQNCISNMQKIRENIKKELSQRGKENIPSSMSPNQFRALKQ
jgi:hypothetical protein